MEDPWLTVAQISERLDLHPDTVRRFLRSGRMRGYLISRKGGWRIRASEVDRFVMESGRVERVNGDPTDNRAENPRVRIPPTGAGRGTEGT